MKDNYSFLLDASLAVLSDLRFDISNPLNICLLKIDKLSDQIKTAQQEFDKYRQGVRTLYDKQTIPEDTISAGVKVDYLLNKSICKANDAYREVDDVLNYSSDKINSDISRVNNCIKEHLLDQEYAYKAQQIKQKPVAISKTSDK